MKGWRQLPTYLFTQDRWNCWARGQLESDSKNLHQRTLQEAFVTPFLHNGVQSWATYFHFGMGQKGVYRYLNAF